MSVDVLHMLCVREVGVVYKGRGCRVCIVEMWARMNSIYHDRLFESLAGLRQC